MTSINDVAKLAGVSNATVSRVLSNKPHVSPEVKDRVLSAVAEIGYRPNRVASNLRKQSTKIIGLLVSDIRNPFFTDIARAIEDVAQQHGMSVFLCNTDEESDKERHYLNTLIDEQAAGIILSPTTELADRLERLSQSNIPIVTIDRRIENDKLDSDCVLADNEASATLLTNHLLNNQFNRIAAVIGLQGSTTGRQRMRGYHKAVKAHGLAVQDALSVYVRPTEREGYQAGLQLLSRPDRPDAIICGNSRITIGVLNAAKELGLTIPTDCAVAGFDETSWMPHINGGITVISQPTYEMGENAAELLFRRIANPDRPGREIVLKSKLLIRASSQKI